MHICYIYVILLEGVLGLVIGYVWYVLNAILFIVGFLIFYDYASPFRECLSENNIKANTYIGHTTTKLSCSLTLHLPDISTIKQHLITKHNKDTDKLKSSDIRKILISNTKNHM